MIRLSPKPPPWPLAQTHPGPLRLPVAVPDPEQLALTLGVERAPTRGMGELAALAHGRASGLKRDGLREAAFQTTLAGFAMSHAHDLTRAPAGGHERDEQDEAGRAHQAAVYMYLALEHLRAANAAIVAHDAAAAASVA